MPRGVPPPAPAGRKENRATRRARALRATGGAPLRAVRNQATADALGRAQRSRLAVPMRACERCGMWVLQDQDCSCAPGWWIALLSAARRVGRTLRLR